MPYLGNTTSIQTAIDQAYLVPPHIQVVHNDIPVPHNMPMPGSIGYIWPPPMGYQHAQAPLQVPTNQTDQVEQQLSSSEDSESSSDDESDINLLGTNIISHP